MSIGASSELIAESEATLDSAELVSSDVAARSPLALFWRRLRADRVAMVSAVFILLLIVLALAAPLVVDVLGLPGPYVNNSNALDAFGSPTGPSAAHPLGVDQLGRDVFSRVIYGSRVSLEVGIIGTAIAAAIGTVMGLLAGFYRGWVDTVISRTVDVFLAFPVLVLGLGIGAACGVRGCAGGLIQPGLGTVIFIITIASFTYIARIVRGQVLSLREKEFIEASRSLGASNRRILFKEILPNLVAPLTVYSSLLIPTNILFEAALSFLGVGIRQPTASWGQMISDASAQSTTEWWYILFPGVALLLTVLAFNLLGDGLLDALNPRGESR
ncbi:MAG: peptide/nickel transport system permease protein [Solirubrobacteraceae bacterium]|jgi:ABC-type dipeptide/oligopeptide/nickel transport system permease subunit|nr:peptide/nickel transport system permease protein [Solirubrobacteraceae bacterium]